MSTNKTNLNTAAASVNNLIDNASTPNMETRNERESGLSYNQKTAKKWVVKPIVSYIHSRQTDDLFEAVDFELEQE